LETTSGLPFLAVVAILAIAILASDFGPLILRKIIEPSVRWIQRVFFGIDRVRTGDEALVGSQAIAGNFKRSEDGGYIGSVVVDGERWSARAEVPIEQGTSVSITSRENLLLTVKFEKSE
jgi:membrane-bound ClpP family serine protease